MRTLTFSFLLLLGLLVPGQSAAQASDNALIDRASDAVRGYVHFGIFDDVEITVVNRQATLTGRVTMPYKRNDIGERVARVDGIRGVENKIEVLPASMSDDSLRTRIARRIYSNPSFWQYASMANPPIHIIVERGRVTLTGCVNSEVERTLAYALAQVEGYFGVTNRLKLDAK
jgi:hyperosmotically inducible protein